MNKDSAWFDTSPERIHQVVGEITLGSEPGGRFYALVAVSTLIASLGLVANSTAVIIGAMLVAPLMTPIFGISLALVRRDNRLLGVALRAEVAGVFVAVAIGTLFGILPLALRVTGEMLARTSPNLLDLLVAVLAGFAGSYAMVDERLSPALPGVAIATAIVPPLANCGLCVAVGAYDGAFGSFLLFLANFFSILLVASATFIAAGLTTKAPNILSWEFVRRFGLAGLGFFVLAAFLTLTLVEMVKERHLTKSIQTVLSQKFEGLHGASLEKAIHKLSQGKLYALASVRTPRVISPDQVKVIQGDLADKVGIPTELMVRCLLSKDVSATGSNLEVTDQNLNGVFFGKIDSHELKIRKVEQLLRERLPQKLGFELLNVELSRFSGAPVVMGTIRAPRALLPEEMRELEKAIQENLQDAAIEFVVQYQNSEFLDRNGRFFYGFSNYGKLTTEKKVIMDQIITAAKGEFQRFPDIFPVDIDFSVDKGTWTVLVETVGVRLMTSQEVADLERALSKKMKKAINVHVFSKVETVVSNNGYASLNSFISQRLQEYEKKLEGLSSSPGRPE